MGRLSKDGCLRLKTVCVAVLVALLSSPLQAQNAEPIILDQIIVEWENIGRSLEETSAANTVIDSEEAEAPANRTLLDAVEGQANVLANTHPSLPVIRGIDGQAGVFGGGAFTAGNYPRVNIVVDGVSRIPNVNGTTAQDTVPWDVSQIEVAKGPQTTLGGPSSLAGAINVVTNDPVFETESAMRVTAQTRGDEPLIGLSGLYNTPLSEQAALRIAFDGLRGDSFVNVVDPSVADDRSEIEKIESETLRTKLLVAPEAVPGLELVLGYERENREDLSSNTFDIDSNDFELSDFPEFNSENRMEQDIFSLRGSYDVSSNLTIEGRAAYTDSSLSILPTNVNFDLIQNFDNVQTEVLARYEGSGFLQRGVIGVAYEDQDEDGFNDTLGQGPLGFLFDVDGGFTNKSVFGEAEFALLEPLFVFAGGRYEDQDIRREVEIDLGFGVPASGEVDTTDQRFSPRLGLRYEFSDLTSVGYQYSEGYRPGSIDVDFVDPSITTTFDGETLRQHEVWARYEDPADRFGINVTAFFYNLEDAQVPAAGPGFLIGNVPDAEGYGLEIDGFVRTGEQGRLTAAIGLLDTEITDAGTDPDAAGLDGTKLPGSADVTLSLGYQYVTNSGWDFGIKATREIGRTNIFAGSEDLPNFTKVNVSAGYEIESGGGNLVRLEAFANNVFDEEIFLQLDPEFGTQTIDEPLTVGLAVTMQF
ncbi:MAG: TonB-dependent receptor [Pseudomonadota bacterium]